MSTPSPVENSSPTAKVDTEVLSEERLTSESSDATLSGGSISSVPSLSSELNDASATTAAAVPSTSARGDIDCGGNDGDKISSVEKKKKSVSISEGDSSNDKATTTDSDTEDCQDASGSSSEVYSGVAGRAGDNPPVADSSTSTDTVQPTVSRKPDVGRPMEMLPGGNTSSMSSLFSADVASSQGEADIYEICTDRQVGSGGGGDDDPWSCNECSLFNQSSNRRCQKCGCEKNMRIDSVTQGSFCDLSDNDEISSVAKSGKVDGNDTGPVYLPFVARKISRPTRLTMLNQVSTVSWLKLGLTLQRESTRKLWIDTMLLLPRWVLLKLLVTEANVQMA